MVGRDNAIYGEVLYYCNYRLSLARSSRNNLPYYVFKMFWRLDSWISSADCAARSSAPHIVSALAQSDVRAQAVHIHTHRHSAAG